MTVFRHLSLFFTICLLYFSTWMLHYIYYCVNWMLKISRWIGNNLHFYLQVLNILLLLSFLNRLKWKNKEGHSSSIHFPALFFLMYWWPVCLGATETAEEMPAIVWEWGGPFSPSLRWVGLKPPSATLNKPQTQTRRKKTLLMFVFLC